MLRTFMLLSNFTTRNGCDEGTVTFGIKRKMYTLKPLAPVRCILICILAKKFSRTLTLVNDVRFEEWKTAPIRSNLKHNFLLLMSILKRLITVTSIYGAKLLESLLTIALWSRWRYSSILQADGVLFPFGYARSHFTRRFCLIQSEGTLWDLEIDFYKLILISLSGPSAHSR